MTGVLKVDDIQDAGANSIVSSNGSGTLTLGSFTAPNITASTAILPDASDGAAIGSASLEWSDIFLADGAVINLGDDQDVTLTHVADTGIQLNSTNKLMFNDASQYIQGASATVLDIAATDEIELTATLVDINANVEISGTAVTTGVHTFTAVPVFPNNTIETADIQADAIDGTKIADDAINSEHYTDGSIDTAHIAADQIVASLIADNAINSEHYTDGSIDTAHIADANVTAAKMFSGFANGITMADQWRLTTAQTFGGTAATLDGSMEQIDTTGQNTIGSAMTFSSGVFTFPSTGIYLILATIAFGSTSADSRYVEFKINFAQDGSNFTTVSRLNGSMKYISDTTYQNLTCQSYVDVTNSTNARIKFSMESQNATIIAGSTSINESNCISFIRLGDT